MALSSWTYILLFGWFLFINCEQQEIENELYKTHLSYIMNYLNSKPERIYNYNYATLVKTQKQSNSTVELTFDVQVQCKNEAFESQCTANAVRCQTLIRINEQVTHFEPFYGIFCDPVDSVQSDETPSPTGEVDEDSSTPISQSELQLSHEIASTVSGEQFVAMRQDVMERQVAPPCVGCSIDLNKNVAGLTSLVNTALHHIESENNNHHVAVKILRIQQQVVAGILYTLLLEVAPTVCLKQTELVNSENCPMDSQVVPQVCKVVYLQQPWINKSKNIVANNCTVTQNFTDDPKLNGNRNDIDNEIDVNNDYKKTKYPVSKIEEEIVPNFDKIADTGRIDDGSVGTSDMSALLAEIESQIEPKDPVERPTKVAPVAASDNTQENTEVVPDNEPNVETFAEVTTENEPEETTENKPNEESFTEMTTDAYPNIETSEVAIPTVESGLDQDQRDLIDVMLLDSTVTTILNQDITTELSQVDKSSEEDNSSEEKKSPVSVVKPKSSEESNESSEEVKEKKPRTKRSLRVVELEKIHPDETQFVKDLAAIPLRTLDEIDEDNNRRVLLQVLGAKKQHGDGITYHLTLRVGVSRCSENNEKADCKNDLLEDLTKVCRVQIHVDENRRNPKVLKSQCHDIKKNESDRNRTARRITGGINEIASDDPKIQELTEHSLKLFDAQSEHSNRYKIVKILKASTQVVSGISYHIKALIVLSDCSKNDNKNLEQCNALSETDPRVCNIKIWDQPWLTDGRQTNITCQDDATTHTFRTKRQIPGGHNPLPVDDPEIKLLTLQSLEKYDSQSEHSNKLKIVEILSASSQVVSGALYRIRAKVAVSDCPKNDIKQSESCNVLAGSPTRVCNIVIWDQPWLSQGRQTNITCEGGNSAHFRSKRQLRGGVKPLAVDDPEIKVLTLQSLEKYDSQSEHSNKLKIIEILSASSQVVSGSLYRITAKVAVSDCPKNDIKQSESCNVLAESPTRICNIVIWDQPWLPQGRQTNITCEGGNSAHFRSKRQIGGPISQAVNDPEIKLMTLQSLEKYDSQSEHSNKLKIVEILSASSQVVSGALYRITAKVAVSDCLKNDVKQSESCNVLAGSPTRVCNIIIWDQPWLPQGRQTNITCEGGNSAHFRSKRAVLGGVTPIGNDDPEIRRLTKESLQKIDSQSEHSNRFKIVEILSATSQVVAGLSYNIQAKISLSDCSKNDDKDEANCAVLEGSEPRICTIKIWDRPWIKNGRQTNITCEDDNKYHFISKKSTDYNLHLNLFKSFIQEHNKEYTNEHEYKFRFRVFRENMKIVEYLNDNELGTAKYGPTKFADLTRDEFKTYLGFRPDLKQENNVAFGTAKIPDIKLPNEFDWRTKGVVSQVKNQGSCGSCWAFSVTGNVEGQYALKYGKLLEFSEQELVDCDKSDEGCNGGLMDNAYTAIEELGGLETEQDYPYDAADEKCHFNKTLARVQLSGALNISHNETDMAKWLVQNGPISIGINANAMQFYMGGISHPWKSLCDPKNLDHGVLIVGYGVQDYPLFKKILPFWIVKNSWGRRWGEQGYYRVFRGDGTCGLNTTPTSGIVA